MEFEVPYFDRKVGDFCPFITSSQTILYGCATDLWHRMALDYFFIKLWKTNPKWFKLQVKKVLCETKNYISKPNSEIEPIETEMKRMQYFGNVISFCPRVKKMDLFVYSVN